MKLGYLIPILSLLVIFFISGCILNEVEIDYGVWNYTGEENWGCRKITEIGLNRAVIDGECGAKCQQEGHTYKQWKCSEPETDKIICVCNR